MSDVAVAAVTRIQATGGVWEYHPQSDITPLEQARCMAYVVIPAITGNLRGVENIHLLQLHRHFRWVVIPPPAEEKGEDNG